MRSAAITVVVFFVLLLGTTVPSPMFPLYESRYGVGPLFITVIFGIYAIGWWAACWPSGTSPTRSAAGRSWRPRSCCRAWPPASSSSPSIRVPAEQRAAAFSAFFVVLYSALALPALGVGFVTELAGLRWAGTVFALLLVLVTFSALVSLLRRRISEPG